MTDKLTIEEINSLILLHIKSCSKTGNSELPPEQKIENYTNIISYADQARTMVEKMLASLHERK